MIRIRGGIVIIDVTTCTGVWGISIVTIMASRTIIGDGRMGTFDDIIVIVYIK